MKTILSFARLLRVRHYIKNFLIFTALLCSRQLFDLPKLKSCINGFIIFSLASSVVYIINDINDIENDKRHPVKSKRPLASGEITLRQAFITVGVLIITVFVAAYKAPPQSNLLLTFYVIMNLAYSYKLKNIPLLDIAILATGFFVRILYGAIITDISISNWLYLTVITTAFYFALGKRRNELKQNTNANTRPVLRFYSYEFLDKNMYMCLSLTNVFYALWSTDKTTTTFYNNRYLIFTVPLVLLITMKYGLDIEGSASGDPVDTLLQDKVLIFLCLLYSSIMLAILYI